RENFGVLDRLGPGYPLDRDLAHLHGVQELRLLPAAELRVRADDRHPGVLPDPRGGGGRLHALAQDHQRLEWAARRNTTRRRIRLYGWCIGSWSNGRRGG